MLDTIHCYRLLAHLPATLYLESVLCVCQVCISKERHKSARTRKKQNLCSELDSHGGVEPEEAHQVLSRSFLLHISFVYDNDQKTIYLRQTRRSLQAPSTPEKSTRSAVECLKISGAMSRGEVECKAESCCTLDAMRRSPSNCAHPCSMRKTKLLEWKEDECKDSGIARPVAAQIFGREKKAKLLGVEQGTNRSQVSLSEPESLQSRSHPRLPPASK